MIVMDDIERERRRILMQETRQGLRSAVIRQAREAIAGWELPPPEPVKSSEPRLDTLPAHVVTAAQLAEVHRRIDRLADDVHGLAKATNHVTDSCAEAFSRQELATAQFEAKVWSRIADLFGKVVASPSPAPSSLLDVTPGTTRVN